MPIRAMPKLTGSRSKSACSRNHWPSASRKRQPRSLPLPGATAGHPVRKITCFMPPWSRWTTFGTCALSVINSYGRGAREPPVIAVRAAEAHPFTRLRANDEALAIRQRRTVLTTEGVGWPGQGRGFVLRKRDETGNALDVTEDQITLVVGSELRRYRLAAGLSLAELARRVHYSKGYLSRIENGHLVAGADLVRRYDAEVGADGRLATMVERSVDSGLLAADESTEEVWVIGMAADGTGWAMPMNRRDALCAGVSSWVGLQLAPQGFRHPAALTPALEGFRALFDQARLLGQVASPGVVLPMVIAQTQAVRGMAAVAARSPEYVALLQLAARYAEFVGWMAQEAGDDRVALGWTQTAAEIASTAGDRELSAHVWVRQALITLYREDAAQTVELAQRAQVEPRVSPRIRGLAALREAQGHALGGDYDGCLRALDQGRQLLDDAASAGSSSASEPVLGPTSVSDMGAVVTGWCLHDLGRSDQAVDILSQEFLRMPETSRRARARYGTRLALAYLGAGEVDQACSLLDQLLDEVEVVDSATIRLDIRRFARFLPQWRSHPHARDLQVRLPALLRVSMH
jgi:transcriptional regulator with XRE-family HTH domain/tetratricopeptide (TPR) repeat protein